jgi:hypothetical protein
MDTITIKIKSVYGNELIYPVCPKAIAFAKIAGTKTLSHNNLCQIEAFGFSINIEPQTLRSAA